jgi:hypothetical protein
MFYPAGNEAFWLNLTNLGLGLVTLAVLVPIGIALGKEAFAHFRKQFSMAAGNETHSFVVGGLGLTMADGGERIPQKKAEKPDPSTLKQ